MRIVEQETELRRAKARLRREKIERRQADLALFEAEKWYWVLAENTTDLTLRLTPEGRIVYVSPACRMLLEYEPEDLIGEELIRYVHLDDVPRIRQSLTTAASKHGSTSVCCRVLKKDGSCTWFETTSRAVRDPVTGALQEVIAVSRDITVRKQAEDALRQERDFVSTILETAGALIVVLDREGRIVRCNRRCEEITGWSFEEVKGRCLWDLFMLPQEVAEAKATFQKLITGRISCMHENYWEGKEGRRLISWTDTALFDATGQVEYVVCVGKDLTGQKQLEREVLQISERERRRIGQDLHDGLGQLITGVLLLSRELAYKLGEKGLEETAYATEILELLSHADAQVHSLARCLVPVDLETGGLPAALSRLAANAETLFRITCTCSLEEDVQHIDIATATDLYRIAQEAISNAVKHGGAQHVAIGLTPSDGSLLLTVEDDGVGFSKERTGEGLGLKTMSYRARSIGATLTIQRRAGGGTVVTCTL